MLSLLLAICTHALGLKGWPSGQIPATQLVSIRTSVKYTTTAIGLLLTALLRSAADIFFEEWRIADAGGLFLGICSETGGVDPPQR